jgi:dolichyl-phosphate-mannose--protein O-mannosyl transferase
MLVFGENAFGWRIPGALLGVASVYLIYLIAKNLFKDELLGILAAAVFALDGLTLVMSRIGMNDSYLLFFVLLSIYCFLKDKNFFSALAFGLALSSKWSAIWAVPIIVLAHFVLKRKIKLSYLFFLVLPPLVYLATYIPMFLTGHGLDIFWGVQKQMWWYHTGLKATHAYTSAWWSWPFLVRPIYLYTSSEIGGVVARIYAMGNPVVFWVGIVAVISAIIYSIQERSKTLALTIFSYLIFFVPWAASPRIMFLYHYLPSIPFLAIATAYFLRRNLRLAIPFLAIGLFVFIYFFPHWAGLTVSLGLDKSYYWFDSWR